MTPICAFSCPECGGLFSISIMVLPKDAETHEDVVLQCPHCSTIPLAFQLELPFGTEVRDAEEDNRESNS